MGYHLFSKSDLSVLFYLLAFPVSVEAEDAVRPRLLEDESQWQSIESALSYPT